MIQHLTIHLRHKISQQFFIKLLSHVLRFSCRSSLINNLDALFNKTKTHSKLQLLFINYTIHHSKQNSSRLWELYIIIYYLFETLCDVYIINILRNIQLRGCAHICHKFNILINKIFFIA